MEFTKLPEQGIFSPVIVFAHVARWCTQPPSDNMPLTYHSIAVRWVALEGLSCEELLQRFTDKQRRRIYSKRVLGLDACGNQLGSLEGLEAYCQLASLSMARCKLSSLASTVRTSCLSLFPRTLAVVCVCR